MGLIDDLKKWAHPYEDEDEEYEDDFAELGSPATIIENADGRHCHEHIGRAEKAGPSL